MTKNSLTDLEYIGRDASGKAKKKKLLSAIDESDLFQKSGMTIIKLSGIQKLANFEKIVEKNFKTEVTPNDSNLQQHAVNIWVGYKKDIDPDNWVRGSGEASRLNTGRKENVLDSGGVNKNIYKEYGTIDGAYRYAMADKRAYSRAVLKLVELVGVYCEEEAQAFSAPDLSKVKGNNY